MSSQKILCLASKRFVNPLATKTFSSSARRRTKSTSIARPNSFTSIHDGLFSHCSGLTTVIIGENVRTIESYAFNSFINLKCVDFYGETAPTISSNPFSNKQCLM